MTSQLAIARAPGRVNIIGDHTDYTGGLVLPMAIDRYTDITFESADSVQLASADEPEAVQLPLEVADPAAVSPSWGRYVAGVVAEMHPQRGIRGSVATDIPIGAGLSSSAALEVAVALALGHQGPALALAQLCQRAENRASGVPSGIMDQLCIAAGVAGHALRIDCGALTIDPIAWPDDVEVVVEFIAHRTLAGSPYAERVADCAAAEAQVGPLRTATLADVARLSDARIRNRATHVVSENQRVRDFCDALAARDLAAAGALMVESHRSLRDRYDTSTPVMDAAVDRLCSTPGVYGARMTGGGFGGCVVAVAQPGVLRQGWVVRAVDGASLIDRGS